MRRSSKLRGIVAAGLALGIFAAPLASASPNFTLDPESLTAGQPATTPDGPTAEAPDAFDRSTAPGALQAACRLAVWPVSQDYSTNWLGVAGGRFDCANYATYTVELRRARPIIPDVHLGTAWGQGNGTATAFAACDGRADYYGRVISSTGNRMDGPHTGLC